MSNSRVKVKGLLKGLRFISQIFDNEKEAEMQIGYPTDVKHVAHIGWDGPSLNSPSWMNEFKSPPSFSSAPLCLPTSDIKQDASVKWVSEDYSRRGEKGSNSSSTATRLGDVPKTSKHPSSIESPTCRDQRSSERQKARRSSKSKESSSSLSYSDPNHSPTLSLPDVPRNGRRKKTSRSKPHIAAETYKSPYSDPGTTSSGTGSISILSKDTDLCQTP